MNNFENYLKETSEVGFVKEVVGVILYINGLPDAKPDELIVFEDGSYGQVFSLSRNFVEVISFSKSQIRVGTRATRTGRALEVPVGESLLSHVIDPFGNPFEGHGSLEKPKQTRPVDTTPGDISTRKMITKHLETGVSIVDLMVPLGRGQRELVIGDRKTGKTNFLLQAVVSAANQGEACIYAAIGKKKSDIKLIEEFFVKNKVMDRVVIVASTSQDAPGVINATPYSGMSIAEDFRDRGKNSFLVLDDLSTHAKFYREISLLGRRFPGRDSYPGDIFYIHAKLLERGGNFHVGDGEASITCLPVVETLQGDLSGYIQTNIMSMTDGHIYFDSNIFSQGRRPAVNPFLSVTRVGRQTQDKSKRSISRELLTFLTLYEKMQNFIHFGSELTPSVKSIIDTGGKIIKLFDQDMDTIVPSNVQTIIISLVWGNEFSNKSIEEIMQFRKKMVTSYNTDQDYKKKIDEVVLSSENFNQILKTVKEKMGNIVEEQK
ncbi:MAG TPA: hypothetical protein VG917_05470 [Patescibacteria group bacterium]|nr:hypothetical protein [Patescibacteria group bacterium]